MVLAHKLQKNLVNTKSKMTLSLMISVYMVKVKVQIVLRMAKVVSVISITKWLSLPLQEHGVENHSTLRWPLPYLYII